MPGKEGDKSNEISIFAFNVNGLKTRIENNFNFKYKSEKGEENKEVKKAQETQGEKYVDIFLLINTRVTDEKIRERDKIITEWVEETEKKYELHCIPAQRPNGGYLFGCKRNITKNFEYKFVVVANHCVIKISSKKDKNTMPTFIIPVYIYFTPSWEEKFEELKVTMSCLKGQNVLLIGDFNAWIGDEQILNIEQELNKDLKEIRSAQHKTNKGHGPTVIKWCKDIGVTVLNGRTKSDEDGKLTCKKSTLDLCFVQGNLHQGATDFEVMEEKFGSDHHPIVAKAQLSFPKGTHILFTDLLAASTRPFEATGTAKKITESEEDKEKAEKSKKLVEKFMGQMVYKKYIESISKMLAKIKDTQVLHELALEEEKEDFFGQNINFETTVFVQNMEKLLQNVINNKLISGKLDFKKPLEEDEIFDKYVLSSNGEFENIAQSFLEDKNVLFAFIAHFGGLVRSPLRDNALLFKMRVFDIKKGFEDRVGLRILLASLEDYLPGGINSKEGNKKFIFVKNKCVIFAETRTMIQRMVKEFKQYCDGWDITVDLKKSKLLIYENIGKTVKI